MFECKDDNGDVRPLEMWYTKEGYVPTITLCVQELYNKKLIPYIHGLELEKDGDDVAISWTPSSKYFTEVQIKNDDEEWITLNLVAKGVGSL